MNASIKRSLGIMVLCVAVLYGILACGSASWVLHNVFVPTWQIALVGGGVMVVLLFIAYAFWAAADIDEERARELNGRMAAAHRHTERLADLRALSLKSDAGALQHLAAARAETDRAAALFAQREFATFWDAMESAARHLVVSYQSLAKVKGFVSEFSALATQGTGPVSPLPALQAQGRVGEWEAVFKTLESLTSRAQRDFEFAQIYQMRRNNALTQQTNELILDQTARFDSLEAAIYGMSSLFAARLSDLAASVDAASAQVAASVDQASARADASASAARRDARAAEENARYRQRETERLLKDIRDE